MKPMLKPPRPTLLKLRYDGPLSDFAFSFNLRRFTLGEYVKGFPRLERLHPFERALLVRRCRLTLSNPS